MVTWVIDPQFLLVPFRSIYNYILGRPFIATLDIVASLIHVKLKYQNFHNDLVTISVDLLGAKRIYKVLQHDQKEGEDKVMEINMAYLVG